MLRPGRHQQAEAIIDSLRLKGARGLPPPAKRVRRAVKKSTRAESSRDDGSELSFRVAQHKNGSKSRVFFRVLESPPRSPRKEIEGHEAAATVKNVLKRLLGPRLVCENALESLQFSDGKISLSATESQNALKGEGSVSSVGTDASAVLDRTMFERIKRRFNIEYLYS